MNCMCVYIYILCVRVNIFLQHNITYVHMIASLHACALADFSLLQWLPVYLCQGASLPPSMSLFCTLTACIGIRPHCIHTKTMEAQTS